MKRLTKLEIIEETLKYYVGHPERRAVDRYGRCSYLDGSGRMCAVGRCLISPSKCEPGGVESNWTTTAELDAALKPQYRGHRLEFWSDLQNMHDLGSHWSNDGLLTKSGLLESEALRSKYTS